LHLFAPEGLNVAVDREIAAGAAPIVARPEPVPPGMRHVASWAYRRRPIELLVEMSRDPLRMTAAVTTQAMVHPRYVELHSRVAYEIESGQTDTFRIAVPPAAAEQVRIEPVGEIAVAQITPGEALEDEWLPWTIVTREPQRGSVAFDVRSELAPIAAERPLVLIAHEVGGADRSVDHAAGSATAAGRRVTVAPVRVLDPHASPEGPALRRAEGQFTAFSSGGLAVRIGPASGDVQASQPNVAITEIPAAAGLSVSEYTPTGGDEPGVVGAFQYDHQHAAWELTWSKATPPEPVTHIQDGRVEIAIPATRSKDVWTNYRCSYTVSSRGTRELPLELPAVGDGNLQSVKASCNGHVVPVLRDPAGGEGNVLYHVSLSPGLAGAELIDKPLRLTLTFRLKLDAPPFRGFGSPLELPLPRIGNAEAVVENLETVLWVPRGFALVGTPIGFEKRPGVESERHSVGRQAASAFAASGRAYVFRRTGEDHLLVVNWWNMRVATWILSAAVLVAALVLRPTSWRNRLTVVLWLCFGVAMLAVAVPDAAAHGIFAARFGLIAGLVLWLLGAPPSRGAASNRSPGAASSTVPLARDSGPGPVNTTQSPAAQRAA
jgi:hypothetical protein